MVATSLSPKVSTQKASRERLAWSNSREAINASTTVLKSAISVFLSLPIDQNLAGFSTGRRGGAVSGN